ncbi:beta-1,3-galactosyltransferase 1-like [Mercenaria mercenaria]|uniref:beta-1,3-galactosyltransferase 1-like n=1 Tax=Mercenaria mercenaria TaxID=6596 RepID=UPI00234EA64D|nr:beta-1,3-galactosyltransferase 1-like [Mercenaria mercenaria]
MAFLNIKTTRKCVLKYLILATVAAVLASVYKNMLTLRTYYDHYNLDDRSYYEDVDLKYPVKVQPNLIRLINPSNPMYPLTINAPYLIENPDLCRSVQNLTVLVVFNTATDHFERRQAIRNTWTNDSYYSDLATVRVLFLLGRTTNRIVQAGIEMEFKEHKDILQGDFIDSYYNLTHKGVMGFKWITERCRNADMILKMDDDILVNMFIYLYRLRHVKAVQTTNVYCDYQPGIISRDSKYKWYAGENHFRGVKSYLSFCKGKFVSMTNDIMPSLYLSASKTPFFHLDDVLLFGYVMHKVPGLHYQTLAEEDMQDNSLEAKQCLNIKREKCPYFVIQVGSVVDMADIWSTILKHFK